MNMKRWTDAKVDKELAFARAANDGTPECVEWLRSVEAEAVRRGLAQRVETTASNPS
jgi:hypothetical protein